MRFLYALADPHPAFVMNIKLLTLLACSTFAPVAFSATLFTQNGTDIPFEKLVKSKKMPDGHSSKTGMTGSRIHVDNRLVELTPEARRPIAHDIMIHTLGNTAIPRADFGKWSRWYQEDGHTQVFRLFTGEENLHNSREKAARIEAFSKLSWKTGPWHEWSGTYTIVKPHGAAIFQAKNNVNDWAFQLDMGGNGDIILNHRHGKDEVIAKGMTEKPFHIRVRDNGHDYEIYLDGRKVGAGSYARPAGQTTFRWGMYVGAHDVKSDAMIFVSGATVSKSNE